MHGFGKMLCAGALAQRESACSTSKRSLVQSQYAPPVAWFVVD